VPIVAAVVATLPGFVNQPARHDGRYRSTKRRHGDNTFPQTLQQIYSKTYRIS
jgi:hypothetical protein